jgi:apolipoprotein N-acyltransferase
VLVRTLCATVAGVLLSLCFEPLSLTYPVPLAVAGFALATRGLRARAAWLPGLAFGVAFAFTHMWWLAGSVGPDAWVGLSAIEAAFYGVLGSVAAVLHRSRWWPAWLATAWVATEAIRTTWPFSGMPWGRLSYAVVDSPWQEVLPYAGQAGLVLLLAGLGTALAWLAVTPGRARVVPAGVAAALLAASLLPALAPYRTDLGDTVTVAVVQGNVPGDGSNILLDPQQVTRNHVDATVGLAEAVAAGDQPEPDFVLWPENSTASDPFFDERVNAGILEAVDAIGVPVLVGAMVDDGAEHVLNQGIVWDPETGAGSRYTKHHPVPFGEYIPWRGILPDTIGKLRQIPRDQKRGTSNEPLTIAGVEVADAICFDIAYDDSLHAQLREGAELLVVQTSNAMFIHTDQIEQQFEITRLRAIETGRYVAVASPNGVSGVVAADGTVLARAGTRSQEVLVQEVRLSDELTPAVRIGPWIGRACVATVALLLAWRLLTYRRRQQGKEVAG